MRYFPFCVYNEIICRKAIFVNILLILQTDNEMSCVLHRQKHMVPGLNEIKFL